MGRETFVERVWEWKAESGGMIVDQQKRLGESCDWSRARFTMDEGLSKAVIKVFVDWYRAGLIYRDKRLVNWDPKFQTAISDLEVNSVETQGHLWHFRYRSSSRARRNTSPSPRPGPRRCWATPPSRSTRTTSAGRSMSARWSSLPLTGREIPIIADEHADPEQGLGRGQDHPGA